MHELGVTQGLLSLVLEEAEKIKAKRILAIDIVIGELSSYVDDSVQFYFDILSQGTIAEGAKLIFHRRKGQALCLDCGYQFEAGLPLPEGCPKCGSPHLQVTGGREFYVESFEVDLDDSGSSPAAGSEASS